MSRSAGRLTVLRALALLGGVLAGCSAGREARIEEVLRRSRTDPERVAELETAYLTDRDRDVRALAAWAIGHAGGKGAEPLLSPMVKDPDAAVRRAVAIALCRTGGEEASSLVVALTSDEEATVRRAAIHCVAAFPRPPPAVLHRALEDEDKQVRAAGLAALRIHPDAEAVPFLLTVFSTRGAEEQTAALGVLSVLGDQSVLPILEGAAASRLAPAVRDAVEAAIIELRKQVEGEPSTQPGPAPRGSHAAPGEKK